jgi:hypothetical protein
MTERLGRPLLAMLAAVVGVLTAGFAPRLDSAIEIVLVENWTRQRSDSRGVPETWRPYETIGGHPAYDFAVVEIDDRRALRMRSNGDHSTIAKKIQIDLNTTPWLEWSWKVVALPDRADIRQRETSDAAAHVFVVWPRWPGMLRSRLIGYIWDASLPVGSIHKSQKTATVTFIVVRSGSAQLGQWVTERRNVREDYRMAFGEEPENPPVIALSIDTNDTKSSSETFIGQIRFRSGER